MRQVLLRFPFDKPWDFGPLGEWPGFGFGLVLLVWGVLNGFGIGLLGQVERVKQRVSRRVARISGSIST